MWNRWQRRAEGASVIQEIRAYEAEVRPWSPERMRQALREDKPKHVLMAVTAEATRRVFAARSPSTCNCRPGLALHKGKIAEMQTGEGKTLAAVFCGGPQRPDWRRRAHPDGQRLPCEARCRMDGRYLSLSWFDVAAVQQGMSTRNAAARITPTSPTPPRTKSASTTCETIFATIRAIWCSGHSTT